MVEDETGVGTVGLVVGPVEVKLDSESFLLSIGLWSFLISSELFFKIGFGKI